MIALYFGLENSWPPSCVYNEEYYPRKSERYL